MKKYIYLFGLIVIMAINGCEETTLLRPAGKNDGVAPGIVRDVVVRNFSGGATLYYTLPDDLDLAYVKASFISTNGTERNVMASCFVDSLVIEGFGDTRQYNVELRAYDKHENASEPVYVTVSPKTAPIEYVFNSLSYEVGYGGFVISFENPTKSNVGIYVMRRNDVLNEMEFYDVYFTSQAKGTYAVRGLPDVTNDFSIYVSDKWGNISGMYEFTATPWREDELDKSKFQWVDPARMIGDLQSDQIDLPFTYLWNGAISDWDIAGSKTGIEFPHRFTVDLGVVAKLSRIKTFQRNGENSIWQHGAWRLFNIYGANEILPIEEQSATDPLKGWTLLGSFESVKPSGLPIGQLTDEDWQLALEGEEFSFELDAPSVRYIRFEITAVHNPTAKVTVMSEINLWGLIEEGEVE